MTKKSKRQMRRPAITAREDERRAPAGRTPEFNPDYSDVKKDLRRIGMLAGSFIALLVILSFFLR